MKIQDQPGEETSKPIEKDSKEILHHYSDPKEFKWEIKAE